MESQGTKSRIARFDTHIEVVTPENIALQYRVAGPFRRLPAYLIDLTVRGLVAFAAEIVFSVGFGYVGMEGLGVGLTLVLWFLLAWFYGGVLEAYWNGQTVGKRLMQIRVVTVDGRPINGLQAVLRNILRTIDAQPVTLYLVGLAATSMNDRFQRLGDLACGSMVVVEQRQWFQGVERIDDARVSQLAAALPPGFQASPTLGRTLATYVQRRRNFSVARRLEIARHLGVPLQQKFNLSADTNHDLLLCALYQRTFLTDRDADRSGGDSPFQAPPAVEAILVDTETEVEDAPIINV